MRSHWPTARDLFNNNVNIAVPLAFRWGLFQNDTSWDCPTPERRALLKTCPDLHVGLFCRLGTVFIGGIAGWQELSIWSSEPSAGLAAPGAGAVGTPEAPALCRF